MTFDITKKTLAQFIENSLVPEGFAVYIPFFFHYCSQVVCADTSKLHQFLNKPMEYNMPINYDTDYKKYPMPVLWHILLHNTIYYFNQSFIFLLVVMLSYSIILMVYILLEPWDSQTHTIL